VEDLTGRYEGTLACKEIAQGNRDKFKESIVPLYVADLGGGEVLIEGAGLGSNFTGFVVADLAKSDRGVLAAVQCGLDDVVRDGAVMNAEIKTKAGTEKASLVGTLVVLRSPSEAAVCKLRAKRVSTVGTNVGACN
jgi:hypothetical protein